MSESAEQNERASHSWAEGPQGQGVKWMIRPGTEGDGTLYSDEGLLRTDPRNTTLVSDGNSGRGHASEFSAHLRDEGDT